MKGNQQRVLKKFERNMLTSKKTKLRFHKAASESAQNLLQSISYFVSLQKLVRSKNNLHTFSVDSEVVSAGFSC